MASLTWLHLSDWHQEGKEFNRDVVRDRILKDIRERVSRIGPDVDEIDFIVFSGDTAFSGEEVEYQAANDQLFTPVLAAAGLRRDRLFIVPGNHDLDRGVFELLPDAILKPFKSEKQVQEWLTSDKKRHRLLEPFEAYNKFVNQFAEGGLSAYSSIKKWQIKENLIALLGINSALMCGRNKKKKGEVDDYGKLVVGEPQYHDALEQISNAMVRIAVMHHPFNWIMEMEQNRVEEQLGKNCHFILCGHQHVSQVKVMQGTSGDCVIIPAGSCYDRRVPEDPRYTNAYNFVSLDFEKCSGTVYLRWWNDRQNEWTEDVGAHKDGKMEFTLPKELGKKSPAVRKASPLTTVSSDLSEQVSRNEREKDVIKAYLKALIRDHKDLDPRGIKQTKVQLVLPLEEIYVSLQADRDRPDVDRRVMQEELEEIKQRLELVEDPAEREKQYQVWATQARVISTGTQLTGKKEKLHDIVRLHKQLTILGDPGSGKTTLLRYLTLRFAREISKDINRLFMPQESPDNGNTWKIPDLGPVRLPILVRISKYADARNPKLGGNPNLALLDFLPTYFKGLNVPDAEELGPIFRRFLDEGRCLVLLDGLDEIVEPTERRNIAQAINRFVGAFRDAGLPEWLFQWMSTGSSWGFRFEKDADEGDGNGDLEICWDDRVSEAQRKLWGEYVQKICRHRHRGATVLRRPQQWIGEPGFTQLGNRFAVTSRIAGYHFAPLGGEFEVFTIRPMSVDDIKLFLEKWCPAVERRMADDPDPVKVEETAQREINGILESVREVPGVRRMAANPLLLRILAVIHRSETHLPQRRVELYETATTTLLRDWNLQKELKVTIDEKEALSLLGAVALWTHENRATGLITRGEVEEILGVILANRHGLISQKEVDKRLAALTTGERSPGIKTLPPEIEKAVETFLVKVREHSGLYVERGEGLYGFMHLTFEEYFAARQLVSSSSQARKEILKRLHQPRWREPILLAVGAISNQFYEDTDALLQAVLNHGKEDPYESILHRNLLFAAACVGDSINVFPRRRQDIARRLIDIFIDRKGRGRYKSLQEQIKTALRNLCNEQGDDSVELALADVLKSCHEPLQIICVLELVNFLKARTPEVLNALEKCWKSYPILGMHNILFDMKQRIAQSAEEEGKSVPTGWKAHLNPETACFMGILWYYKWKKYLPVSLGLPKKNVEQINKILKPFNMYRAINQCRELINDFRESSTDQRKIKFWENVYYQVYSIVNIPGIDRSLLIETINLALDFEVFAEHQKTGLWTINDILRSVSHLELRGDEIKQISESIEEAVDRFEKDIEEYEKKIENYQPLPDLEAAGIYILEGASASHTLAHYFVDAAKNFISLTPYPRESKLQSALDETLELLYNNLLDVLSKTDDFQQYREIVLFLLFRGETYHFGIEEKIISQVTSFLFSELESSDKKRQVWALQLLAEPAVQKHIKLKPEQHQLLMKLLDGTAAQALCSLSILDFTPELLSWCLESLRKPDHPLAYKIVEKLEGMERIPGTSSILDLLEHGMREPTLRSTALEMLLKIDWKGIETFSYVLRWLTEEDDELRYIGTMLLAQQDNIFEEVYKLLRNRANIRISTIPSQGSETKEKENWAYLKNEPQVVRLLGGLWLNGWQDILSQLWVESPARSYMGYKKTDVFWHSSQSYPECEEAVRWMLEKAEHGQVLISQIKQAAKKLVKFEKGEVKGEPGSEHMKKIIDWLSEQWASSPDTAGLLSPAILRKILITADAHPMIKWLEEQLTSQGLSFKKLSTPENLRKISYLLQTEDVNLRMAAALSLLSIDLYPMILKPLAEAALSENDLIRNPADNKLCTYCKKLPTDGSSCAVDELLRLRYRTSKVADGYLVGVYFSALRRVRHSHLYYLKSWIKTLSKKDTDPDQREIAELGFNEIGNLSEKALKFLIEQAGNKKLSQTVRGLILSALWQNQRDPDDRYNEEWFNKSLCQLLNDSESDLRRIIGRLLQWCEGPASWEVAQELLKFARSDEDTRTRLVCIISAGRALHAARRFYETDVSKEAFVQWMLKKANRSEYAYKRFFKIEERLLQSILKSSFIENCTTAEKLLDALSELEESGIADNIASRWIKSEGYHSMIKAAKEEWDKRNKYLKIYSHLGDAVSEIESYLSSQDENIRHAAACSLACTYRDDVDRLLILEEKLRDAEAIMWAMIESVSDSASYWAKDDYHEKTIKQLSDWLAKQAVDNKLNFIDNLLKECQVQMSRVQKEFKKDGTLTTYGFDFTFPLRESGICIGLLAELSEQMTYKGFIQNRSLEEVLYLLLTASHNPNSWITRRVGIKVLGNLQQFNKDVAQAFFEACQDYEGVYEEAQRAVGKFKHFDEESLHILTKAIDHPGVIVAHNAALLLGELGVSRSEELGAKGRRQVADELLRILKSPAAERIVYDFTEDSDGKRIGPLYDVLYDSLVRVIAGPDAKTVRGEGDLKALL